MAKATSEKDDKRQLDIVLDMSFDEKTEHTDHDWVRRHTVLPTRKKTATENEQKHGSD